MTQHERPTITPELTTGLIHPKTGETIDFVMNAEGLTRAANDFKVIPTEFLDDLFYTKFHETEIGPLSHFILGLYVDAQSEEEAAYIADLMQITIDVYSKQIDELADEYVARNGHDEQTIETMQKNLAQLSSKCEQDENTITGSYLRILYASVCERTGVNPMNWQADEAPQAEEKQTPNVSQPKRHLH